MCGDLHIEIDNFYWPVIINFDTHLQELHFHKIRESFHQDFLRLVVGLCKKCCFACVIYKYRKLCKDFLYWKVIIKTNTIFSCILFIWIYYSPAWYHVWWWSIWGSISACTLRHSRFGFQDSRIVRGSRFIFIQMFNLVVQLF